MRRRRRLRHPAGKAGRSRRLRRLRQGKAARGDSGQAAAFEARGNEQGVRDTVKSRHLRLTGGAFEAGGCAGWAFCRMQTSRRCTHGRQPSCSLRYTKASASPRWGPAPAARVVASDLPELREGGGPEGIYVTPTVEGIRAGARLWSARRLPGLVRRLARHAREFDLIYANSKKALLFAAPRARLASRPLIWHQHDEMRVHSSLPFRGRLSEEALAWLLNRVARESSTCHRHPRIPSLRRADERICRPARFARRCDRVNRQGRLRDGRQVWVLGFRLRRHQG